MNSRQPQVATRVAPDDEKKILALVEQGRFINVSDFLRTAIREELEKVEEGQRA